MPAPKDPVKYQQWRANIGKTLKGRKPSEKCMQACIKANTGREMSDKTKQALLKANLGVKHSEEHKRKVGLSNKGKLKGRVFSEETKQRMSLAQKGKKLSEEHKQNIKTAMWRPDVRANFLESIGDTPWLKVKCDKGQLELLEKWNRLGFNFEPNYQIKTAQDLFYIDGYDKEHNVVIEYDSAYHNLTNQKAKDTFREQRIIAILHPKKFWRYDAVNKVIRNVI